MALLFSVIRYWCSTAPAGTSTPAMRATSRAQMPAAMTTISQAMAPWSVSTRLMRRPSASKPVTRTFSTMRTPLERAPLA